MFNKLQNIVPDSFAILISVFLIIGCLHVFDFDDVLFEETPKPGQVWVYSSNSSNPFLSKYKMMVVDKVKNGYILYHWEHKEVKTYENMKLSKFKLIYNKYQPK